MKTENTHIKGCSFSSTAYDKFQENGRQNIFEEVIDNLIAEGLDIPSDFIENLPVEEKREFILNCLIPEEGPTINEMFKNIRNSETRSQHLKNSIETIKEFIKVGKQEVKKYGEVYTPITLVQEMLDTLPEDVWSNPDLKFLDPANGMGNFPLVVIVRLMKGLQEWEPDVEKRYKHIIENMVYVSELQPRNCFIYLSLVDPNDEYDVNLYCGSFLDDPFNDHMKDVWELDKFDIVVGNPPYNEEFSNSGTAKDLFDKFIFKSYKFTQLILMITPSRWFTKKSLRKIRILLHDKVKLIKHFKDSSEIFEKTEITSGVSYFLFDKKYEGDVIFNNKSVDLKQQIKLLDKILYDQNENEIVLGIINKVSKFKKLNNFNPKGYFGIKSNQIEKNSENREVICYYSDFRGKKENMNLKNGRYYNRINKKLIKDTKNTIMDWKLITSSAYGANPNGIGRLNVIKPNEICSESFVFFNFGSEVECHNLKRYLDTKIIRYLISLSKNKQDVTSGVFNLIPNLDFRNTYSDKVLKIEFKLTDEEFSFIQNNI